MAVIDVAGFVADLKDHAVDHGFHVHDERHFVETYSLRQAWEVDLHPEEALRRPARPAPVARGRPPGAARVRGRGDRRCDDDERPARRRSTFPLVFTWALPPLPHGPDLLVLATELAGVGGPTCPSRSRPSTRSPRSPTPPSAASRSSPASRSSLDRDLPRRRSSSATCSTAATRSAGTCSTARRSGSTSSDPSTDVRFSHRRPRAGPSGRASGVPGDRRLEPSNRPIVQAFRVECATRHRG